MFSMIKLISKAIIFLLLVSACTTIRNGGAPEPSFDIDADLEKISKEFEPATNITNYYQTPIESRFDARNKFITGRLVQIDLQYLKFIRSLTSNKQQIDAATDIASLSLNLAGTLVSGTQAKTNLAATAAGLGGIKTTIDKDFYYEKSIEALVVTMNAKRKQTLINILTGLNAPIQQYPFERAITDLQQYYLAGTLNGAVQFINVQAAESEVKSDKALNILYQLPVLSDNQIDTITKLTDAIGSSELTIEKAQQILREFDSTAINAPDFLDDTETTDGLKTILKSKIRTAKNIKDDTLRSNALSKITTAFKNASILKD
jgi:hypothetical protein